MAEPPVVDDTATNRFLLTEQLSGWALDVTAVESAHEALVELDTSVRRSAPWPSTSDASRPAWA